MRLGIGCAAAVVCFTVSPIKAQEDGIRWFDNYATALREAKRTGKPIFLEYRCEP